MHSPRSTGRRLRPAGLALALAAGLLVSGCGLLPSPSLPPVPTPTAQPTVPAGGGEQSEQCAQLMTEVQGIAVDVARVPELLGTDFLQAGLLVADISSRVNGLEARVTDPALLERIAEIQAGWDAVAQDAQRSFESGDVGGIDRAVTGLTQLSDQVAALQEFCAGTA